MQHLDGGALILSEKSKIDYIEALDEHKTVRSLVENYFNIAEEAFLNQGIIWDKFGDDSYSAPPKLSEPIPITHPVGTVFSTYVLTL